METIFINSKNNKTSEPHIFRPDLSGKIGLKQPKKNMALVNLSVYCTWKNIKSEYNNNKFKISALTWNDTFDLPEGPYSISDIQDYFEIIIKKHETLTENSPIKIYQNKIKNRSFFKNRLQIRIVNPWNNEIVRKHKKDVDKDKDGKNVQKLESVEVVLVHCNLV